MKTIKNISFLTVLCTVIAMSCSDETFDPVLKDSSTFEPPVFESPATTSPAIFTEENLGEVYEVFKWKKTDYGVSLSTNYVLEVDDDSDFDAPKNLATTSANEVSVSKEAINNAIQRGILSA